jgi:hypothetical protein
MNNFNYKTLAAAAGLKKDLFLKLRKELFKKHPDLKKKFGKYEHRTLKHHQVSILVLNIDYLKPLANKILES